MAAMKIRYPEGVAIDDLEVTQKYRIDFRGTSKPITGELRQVLLRRGKVPALTILPDGKPMCVDLAITKIAKIEAVEADLRGSDYRDDEGDKAT